MKQLSHPKNMLMKQQKNMEQFVWGTKSKHVSPFWAELDCSFTKAKIITPNPANHVQKKNNTVSIEYKKTLEKYRKVICTKHVQKLSRIS